MVPKPNLNYQNSLHTKQSRSLRKTTMKRFFAAILLSALVFFGISGAVHGRVNPGVISGSSVTSVQDILEKMTSEPASMALLGAGLLWLEASSVVSALGIMRRVESDLSMGR